jgi:H+/Cl- antiporter ClcA
MNVINRRRISDVTKTLAILGWRILAVILLLVHEYVHASIPHCVPHFVSASLFPFPRPIHRKRVYFYRVYSVRTYTCTTRIGTAISRTRFYILYFIFASLICVMLDFSTAFRNHAFSRAISQRDGNSTELSFSLSLSLSLSLFLSLSLREYIKRSVINYRTRMSELCPR